MVENPQRSTTPPGDEAAEARTELRRTVWDGAPRLSAFLAAHAPTSSPASSVESEERVTQAREYFTKIRAEVYGDASRPEPSPDLRFERAAEVSVRSTSRGYALEPAVPLHIRVGRQVLRQCGRLLGRNIEDEPAQGSTADRDPQFTVAGNAKHAAGQPLHDAVVARAGNLALGGKFFRDGGLHLGPQFTQTPKQGLQLQGVQCVGNVEADHRSIGGKLESGGHDNSRNDVNPQRSTAQLRDTAAQARADAEAAAHRTEPSPAAASLLLAGLTATACGVAAWAYFTLSADAAREAARRPAFMKTVELPAGRCLQPRQGEVLFITVNASGSSHEQRAPLQVACQTVRGQERAR